MNYFSKFSFQLFFFRSAVRGILFTGFLVILGIFAQCAALKKEPGRPPKINGEVVEDKDRYLFVQNFRNNSYGPGIHTRLTEMVKTAIDRRGRFLQTRDKLDSTYRLHGEIVHYQLVGNLVDSTYNHISREMTIIVKLEIHANGGKSLDLVRNEIPVRIVYSEQIGLRESETQAQNRALRILAARIAEESEQAWYHSLPVKIKHRREQ